MVLSSLSTPTSASGLVESALSNPTLVGSAWVVSSAIFTTYTTTSFLNYDPGQVTTHKKRVPMSTSISRPSLLTLYRFGGSFLLGLLLHPNLQVSKRLLETIRAIPSFALPALFLFTANFSNSISLERVGISLTYTTKCAIPILTAILAFLIDGPSSLPNGRALLSLLPIAVGIAAASWKSPELDKVGISAAFVSATAQSALNVSSKRVMRATHIGGPSAQRVMVGVGLLITLTITAFEKLIFRRLEESATPITKSVIPPKLLSLGAMAAYHVEYVLSFIFVGLTSPVTYGACDAMRRLAVILSGRGFFGGAPLTATNTLGILLAVVGAGSYSIATHM